MLFNTNTPVSIDGGGGGAFSPSSFSLGKRWRVHAAFWIDVLTWCYAKGADLFYDRAKACFWGEKTWEHQWFDLLSPLFLGNCLLSTLPISEQTSMCTWAHSCILWMSYLIFHLLFSTPPTSLPSCHLYFSSTNLSSLHAPHPLLLFPSSPLL